jgi:hypothetical protein
MSKVTDAIKKREDAKAPKKEPKAKSGAKG